MTENRKKYTLDTRSLVLLGLLTAIVVVLQVIGATIRFGPFSITLVLMPIVVGAALIGVFAGGWLGFVFGFVVLITGGGIFWAINPLGTLLVTLVRCTLAGMAAGAAYQMFANRNKTVAAVIAAAACPIVNTGLFVIGAYIFFLPILTEWGEAAGYSDIVRFIFLGLVGTNFLLEFALNLLLSPIIVRLIQYGRDRRAA